MVGGTEYGFEGWPAAGVRISARRLQLRLSREGLAEAAGVSGRTVADLERGQRTSYHASSLRKVETALGWSPGIINAIVDGRITQEDFRAMERGQSTVTEPNSRPGAESKGGGVGAAVDREHVRLQRDDVDQERERLLVVREALHQAEAAIETALTLLAQENPEAPK